VFEIRVLRVIFGPKMDEVTGEWRTLHNEELNELSSSLNIICVFKSRRMSWAGHVGRREGRRHAYRGLVGRLEGKKPLGRHKPRWEDNVKMHLEKVGWGGGLD
jgi:hypothetical protein